MLYRALRPPSPMPYKELRGPSALSLERLRWGVNTALLL